MKKSKNLIIIISFAFVILYTLIVFFKTEDIAFSVNENRKLSQKPKLKLAKVLSGTYFTDIEKYISDQFPFREMSVGLKTKIELAFGKKENNEVYYCKDMLIQKISARDTEDLFATINTFMEKNPIKASIITIPTKSEIYKEKLPSFAKRYDEAEFIEKAKNGLNIDVISPLEIFRDKKDDYLFFNTDNHWTINGSYISYQMFMEKNNRKPIDFKDFSIKNAGDFYGTLYSSSGYREIQNDSIDIVYPKKYDKITVDYKGNQDFTSLYDESKLDTKDKYATYLGGNYPFISIDTKNEGPSLLIIKDSYANSLVPFLAEHYSKIDLLDPRFVSKETMSGIKYDYDELVFVYNIKNLVEDDSIDKINF